MWIRTTSRSASNDADDFPQQCDARALTADLKRLSPMPLTLVGRTKDAVVSVPAAARWQDGVGRFLRGLTDDEGKIGRHLDLLQQRVAGELSWHEVLTDRVLPNGRPMPPSRRYAEMLVNEEQLPLYEASGLRFSLDLHNPGNEAQAQGYDSEQLELAIVADVDYFAQGGPPGETSNLPHEERAARRVATGRVLGDQLARLMESTAGVFAYADIAATLWPGNASGRWLRKRDPATLRPWDFLWSITIWSPSLLTAEDRETGLSRIALTEDILAGVDRFERPYVEFISRRLANDELFLQYRQLLGVEHRGSRSALDTPLSQQAGLLSTASLHTT